MVLTIFYLQIWIRLVDFMVNVGKYTRPMDGTGYILTIVSKPPKWGWSISKWLGLHQIKPMGF